MLLTPPGATSSQSEESATEAKESNFRFGFIIMIAAAGIAGLILIFFSFMVKFWFISEINESLGHDQKMAIWGYELTHFMLLEVGIGFITALVLALTIDITMRIQETKEHEKKLKEIGKNVFNALFRTAVASDLVDEMYKALLLPKFVREELELTYKFSLLPGQENIETDERKLLLTHTVSFKARNITDKKVGYTMSPQTEVLLKDGRRNPFKEFSMQIERNNAHPQEAQPIHLTEDNIAKIFKQSEDGIRYFLGEQKISAYPNECISVRFAIEKICRTYDTEYFVTAHSAKGLTLIVETDANVPPLNFIVDQAHRQDLEEVTFQEPTSLARIWRLNYAILPYQGVMLYWCPKEQPVPQPAEAPESLDTEAVKA